MIKVHIQNWRLIISYIMKICMMDFTHRTKFIECMYRRVNFVESSAMTDHFLHKQRTVTVMYPPSFNLDMLSDHYCHT